MSLLPHPVFEAWKAQATLHAQLDTDPQAPVGAGFVPSAPHSPYFPIWKENDIMIAPVSEPWGGCFGGIFMDTDQRRLCFPWQTQINHIKKKTQWIKTWERLIDSIRRVFQQQSP